MIPVPLTGVWGWPWHGLCSGGTIAGPAGKTQTQPEHGNAWLLDLGLPDITLSGAEDAEATAQGYTWLTYAMVSGGYLYGTYLGDDCFIHIDEAGAAWHVALSYSVPSSNTLRVSANVVRFGVFGHGMATPFSMSVDVACDHIELTTATGNPVNNYDRRVIALEDVWTNGARALVGVVLQSGSGATTENDLFSVVEITLTGTGGADGSGLSLAVSEVLGQDQLTVKNQDNGNHDDLGTGQDVGIGYTGYAYYGCPEFDSLQAERWYEAGDYAESHWNQAEYPVLCDYYFGNIWARAAYYDSTGVIKVLRLEAVGDTDHYVTAASGANIYGRDENYCNSTGWWCYSGAQWSVDVAGYARYIIRIMANDTVIDHLSAEQTFTGQQLFTVGAAPGATPGSATASCGGSSIATTYDNDGPVAFTGSLSTYFDDAEAPGFDYDSIADLVAAWRAYDPHESDANVLIGAVRLGLQRIDAKAAALYKTGDPAGARTYGTIATPLGSKTYSGTAPSSNLYFAWQRKTGDFSFSTSPICYV